MHPSASHPDDDRFNRRSYDERQPGQYGRGNGHGHRPYRGRNEGGGGGGGGNPNRLINKGVTIRWLDGSTINWNWFRVVGIDNGLIGLQPLDMTGEQNADMEAFWTPVQSIDKLVTRHIHDGDLGVWLKA